MGLIEINYGGLYSDTLHDQFTWNTPNQYQIHSTVIYDSTKALNIWETEAECIEAGCQISDSLFFCANSKLLYSSSTPTTLAFGNS